MNRQELVDSMAEATGLSKTDSAAALQAALDAIGDALAGGDKVSLVGFGTFEARQRAARDGINPQSGAKIKIAAKTVPAFKPGTGLREKVAG
jgi:DNA-binding protein HU-beta